MKNYLSACLLAFVVAGCAATSPSTIRTYESSTSRGKPYIVTLIPVSSAPMHSNVQVAAGSVWATQASMLGLHTTIRVDQKSLRVSHISRPFTAGLADLLATDDSLWFSDGITKLTGGGKLYRTDLRTDRTTVVDASAGIPFGASEGIVWSHNPRTGTVTGIDTGNNEVRFKHSVTEGPGGSSFSLGAGAIWQFMASPSRDGDQSGGVVLRIDPRTGNIVARIDAGAVRPTDVIRFAAGDVWILGESKAGGNAVAVRIDAQNSRVKATIRLAADIRVCAARTFPRTPVETRDGVWISTFCSHGHRVPGILLKIDLKTNKVTDELRLTTASGHQGGQPTITGDETGIWGFDGRAAFRVKFKS